MEWSKTNQYNSFNSYKGLTYYNNYRNIMSWMERETDYLPPPIECNLDPFAECNNRCYFCIGQRYLVDKREEVGEMRKLPTEYMLKLVEFLSRWGVRGLCISGGGEPSLHEGIYKVMALAKRKGMDVSFVTNAVRIPKPLGAMFNYCRWVAISVNAGKRETYNKVAGKDHWNEVIYNIEYLCQMRKNFNSKVDYCYKFLVLPENQYEIYEACKLAKDLGVQDFHVRPADLERGDIKGNGKLELDLKAIEEQFEKCHAEETNEFHVFTITHKFDPCMHVKHDFTRCLASPLVVPILSDGNVYLCVDKKMESPFRLGAAYPNPESILTWWGSEEHRKLIESVDINKCSRCTWGQYNLQCEKVVENDGMCLSFP
jgi:molybdenum cofactor biosynthesis enzyme MoaA